MEKKVRCPICSSTMPGNWADYPEYPFCSRRCKTIDLGRWLGEDYKLESKDDRNQSSSAEPGSEPQTSE